MKKSIQTSKKIALNYFSKYYLFTLLLSLFTITSTFGQGDQVTSGQGDQGTSSLTFSINSNNKFHGLAPLLRLQWLKGGNNTKPDSFMDMQYNGERETLSWGYYQGKKSKDSYPLELAMSISRYGDLKVRRSILVTNSDEDWPDYVFKKDYPLMSIEEVENYINTNQHLPEVPSEADITKNGLDLVSMNATLLKKIEELTLYVIKLNKEINELKK